nr:immunoglobulin heavy chain junction region [Mus musculus]MBK4188756.1 immunoglobulin heavy chain junction region [Mus musculus]
CARSGLDWYFDVW